MSNNIPITLFRDLPVYSGALPPDGVQIVVVEGNTNVCRAGLESVLGSTVTLAEGVPSHPGDTLAGKMAWEDGALYVNTEAGWEKAAIYADNWDDIGPGTRFMRVDAPMTLTPSEVDNVISSLGISEATTSSRGLVYIAGSIAESTKVATAGLVKGYVDSFVERVEEVYTYVQEVAGRLDETKAAVDAALEEIRDIGSGVEEAKAYVDDVKEDVEDLAGDAGRDAGRAELAADRAERAAEAIPGFDDRPTAGSMNVVRSGGIKVWGDTSFAPVSHVSDVGTGNDNPHVSAEDRERWDAASGGSVPERYVNALKRIVDHGEITGPDIKIGTGDSTIVWARAVDEDGSTALTLSSDSVSILSPEGLEVTGNTAVTGNVAVTGNISASGTVSSAGYAVLTVNDVGSFPTGGSQVDGYATVGDAVTYIAQVETSIKDYVAANYTRVPAGGGYAELEGNNTMTGHNVFTGEANLQCPVTVEGSALVCVDGISVVGGGVDVGTGGYISAPDADIGALHADLVDIGTGGSLRVDGDTNVAGLAASGDLQVGGMSAVAGTLYADGGIHVGGVTVLGDRIESDVEIGYGPLGNVQAEALLEIGDPRAAGYMEYNGYRLVLGAGERAAAHGQLKLLDGYQTCIVSIGDETRSISPVPRDASPTQEYYPVTPQQVATLVSTIPGYTGAVNSYDASVVDVTATQTGTIGNKPMAASYGGLAVKTPLDGGRDDRTVADLVESINGTDIFDLTAHVQTVGTIRLTARQAGEEPNDKPVTTSGCFGSNGTVMGSSRRGAEGIPGSNYKLWLNGKQVLPGGGGGGEPFDGHLEADLHVGHEGTDAVAAVCTLTLGDLASGGTLDDSNGQSVELEAPHKYATGTVSIPDATAAGTLTIGEWSKEWEAQPGSYALGYFLPVSAETQLGGTLKLMRGEEVVYSHEFAADAEGAPWTVASVKAELEADADWPCTILDEESEVDFQAPVIGESWNDVELVLEGDLFMDGAVHHGGMEGGEDARTAVDVFNDIHEDPDCPVGVSLDADEGGLGFTAKEYGVNDTIRVDGDMFANWSGMSGGHGDYSVAELVTAIAGEFEDITPAAGEVEGTIVLTSTATEHQADANRITYTASGCFGRGTVRQGSTVPGKDAVDPSSFKIYLNGEDILAAPTHESTIPAVLLHSHVYSVEVSSGTVDLSGKTVEARATCELYIDYTGGTLVLPTLWWIDGTSSAGGDHDIPPWGQNMEANHRYVVTLRNDGTKVVANLAYDYPL